LINLVGSGEYLIDACIFCCMLFWASQCGICSRKNNNWWVYDYNSGIYYYIYYYNNKEFFFFLTNTIIRNLITTRDYAKLS
jgi:hypothetical protein